MSSTRHEHPSSLQLDTPHIHAHRGVQLRLDDAIAGAVTEDGRERNQADKGKNGPGLRSPSLFAAVLLRFPEEVELDFVARLRTLEKVFAMAD